MTAAQLLDSLVDARYLALDIELQPVGSPSFQPTTFANTGSSFYEAPDGHLAAIVDSVASMANQLELTIWDEAASAPTEHVAPLPWIRVIDEEDAYYTSSRRAAHRLNAVSIMNGVIVQNGTDSGEVFGTRVQAQLAAAKPPMHRHLAGVLWEYDPLTLIHGCWFAGIWDGRARVTRALAARIDALGVQSQSVQVGGQKSRDTLDEPGSVQDAGFKTVRGEAPYYTSEVSATRIVAPIVLDIALLRSYGLASEAFRALLATSILQIAELVAAWPRRRSRCMMQPKGVRVRLPENWTLPDLDELRRECLVRCRNATGCETAEPLVVRRPA